MTYSIGTTADTDPPGRATVLQDSWTPICKAYGSHS